MYIPEGSSWNEQETFTYLSSLRFKEGAGHIPYDRVPSVFVSSLLHEHALNLHRVTASSGNEFYSIGYSRPNVEMGYKVTNANSGNEGNVVANAAIFETIKVLVKEKYQPNTLLHGHPVNSAPFHGSEIVYFDDIDLVPSPHDLYAVTKATAPSLSFSMFPISIIGASMKTYMLLGTTDTKLLGHEEGFEKANEEEARILSEEQDRMFELTMSEVYEGWEKDINIYGAMMRQFRIEGQQRAYASLIRGCRDQFVALYEANNNELGNFQRAI